MINFAASEDFKDCRIIFTICEVNILKFIEKIKLTYKYYKSLGTKNRIKNEVQNHSKVSVRSDVYAFLTYPGVLPEERIEM